MSRSGHAHRLHRIPMRLRQRPRNAPVNPPLVRHHTRHPPQEPPTGPVRGAAFVPRAGYFTGFHTAHPSDVNCPSDDRIVTMTFRGLVANWLSMGSPDSVVRTQ